jgi:hypothetical protein
MNNLSLNLPPQSIDEIVLLAQKSSLSVEQWLINAIVEKIEAEKKIESIKNYADRADYAKFDEILARVPAIDPIIGDEIE